LSYLLNGVNSTLVQGREQTRGHVKGNPYGLTETSRENSPQPELIKPKLHCRNASLFFRRAVNHRTLLRGERVDIFDLDKFGGSWRIQSADLVQWMNERANCQAGRAHRPKGDED